VTVGDPLRIPDDVVPVLDLLGGRAVRGVGGRRDSYRTLREEGLGSDDPLEAARALRERRGASRFYVADLDALRGGEPAIRLFERLIDDGFGLVVDADWVSARHRPSLERLLQRDRFRPIVSLESLANVANDERRENAAPSSRDRWTSDSARRAERLREAFAVAGDRAIFSLDLFAGRVWFGEPVGASTAGAAETLGTARDWAIAAATAGFRELLLLDLADVGEGRGLGTLSLVRSLRDALSEIRFWGGGGVRSGEDLVAARQAGFSDLLVGTAVHRDVPLPNRE